MNDMNDIRKQAMDYLKQIGGEVSSHQSIAKELCKEVNADVLNAIIALFDEYNKRLAKSYEGFVPAREDYHLQQVLNANRILVCPAMTRILSENDDGHVVGMCSLAYISLDAAEIGDVAYVVVSDLEYVVNDKYIELPPLLLPEDEQEELTEFGDPGDVDQRTKEKWETENALFGQFLMAAKTLTLTGYEVYHLSSEKKPIDIHGNTQEISFPILDIFDPKSDPPRNLCVVNLCEYIERPGIVLNGINHQEETEL